MSGYHEHLTIESGLKSVAPTRKAIRDKNNTFNPDQLSGVEALKPFNETLKPFAGALKSSAQLFQESKPLFRQLYLFFLIKKK